jgi:hypothetical protein
MTASVGPRTEPERLARACGANVVAISTDRFPSRHRRRRSAGSYAHRHALTRSIVQSQLLRACLPLSGDVDCSQISRGAAGPVPAARFRMVPATTRPA